MPSVVAYGRVNGNVHYQYGPKHFDLDLKSVFYAIDVMRFLQKIPTSMSLAGVAKKLVPKSKLPDLGKLEREVGEKSSDKLLCELIVLAKDFKYVLISRNSVNRIMPDELSAETIPFSDSPEEGLKMLADYLTKIGLNTWGVLRQINFALAGFTVATEAENGIHGITIDFTV